MLNKSKRCKKKRTMILTKSKDSDLFHSVLPNKGGHRFFIHTQRELHSTCTHTLNSNNNSVQDNSTRNYEVETRHGETKQDTNRNMGTLITNDTHSPPSITPT